MVRHFWMVIGSLHHNKGLSSPKCLIGGHSSNNHLSDGVENPSLPIVVVSSHFFTVLRVCLESTLFYASKIRITDVLIVFYKFGNNFLSVAIEKLRKLCYSHDFLLWEVKRSHQDSVLYVLHFFLDVIGVLQYATLCFFEFINTFEAIFDVFRNTQAEPVVVLLSFVHETIKLFYLLLKQFLFNWPQI